MQHLFNGPPGLFIVLALVIVAALLGCVELWRCREAIKAKVKAAWGDGLRWFALLVVALGVINVRTIPPDAPAFAAVASWSVCIAWGFGALMLWRKVLLREVRLGDKIPPFYGIAFGHYNSPTLFCAPAPFNILIGWLHSFYYFVRAGWRTTYADPRQAYWQGRKEAFAYVREQAKQPGWFERYVAGEFEVR